MKNKKTENIFYKIIIFTLIFALIISIFFTIDRLIFKKPVNNCNYIYQKDFRNDNCNYDDTIINKCYIDEGQIIFKNDCTLTCNYCYKEYNQELLKYNNKINILRIILSFIISISLTFINFKDKIIKYSLLSGTLISLFVATLMSMNTFGILLPIIIIIEFLLVLFIYKKTK